MNFVIEYVYLKQIYTDNMYLNDHYVEQLLCYEFIFSNVSYFIN